MGAPPEPRPLVPTHAAVHAFAEGFAAQTEGAASIEVTVHDPGTERYPWGTSEDGHVLLTVAVTMGHARRDGECLPDGQRWEGLAVVPADARGNPEREPARAAGVRLGRACAREMAATHTASGKR
jgi:hypothetical protein